MENMQDERNHRMRLLRRRFLQGISSGTVATVLRAGHSEPSPAAAGAASQSRAARKSGPSVQLRRSRLPVLREADVAVIGGSITGVAAALQFARAGRKVVLVEHRNYLGREISATLKPWVDLGRLSVEQAPEPIATCLRKQMKADAIEGEIPLWMDGFKLALEDAVLGAAVELVYGSLPTEAIVAGGAIRGVVIGNKSGRQAVLAPVVVDATSTALVARVAGAAFVPETPADYQVVRVLEMDGVRPLGQAALEVPAELGIAGSRVTIHNGYRGAGHVLIDCPMELKMGKLDLEGMMQRELEARHRTMRVAAHLIQNVPNFKDAKLAICAYELDGPQTTRLAGPAPAWVGELKGAGLEFSDKNQEKVQLPLAVFAGPVKGLWCLDEAARLEGVRRELLHDPVNAALAGAAFAKAMLPRLAAATSTAAEERDYEVAGRLGYGLVVKFQDSPQRGRFYKRVIVPAVKVSVVRETDVLVVGGGTSGATCASAAGREGARAVLLDLCPGLGGTGTLGGVCGYFYGRYWTGFTLRNAQLVDEIHKSIHWPTSANALNGRWNIEAKMYALLKDAQQAGVELLFSCTAIATVLHNNQVRGVVAATPYGPAAVLSKVTADTTGDGDVAAFAGAEFVFGPVRDHYPMWYNLAQYTEPAASRWHFMHTVDVTNVDDCTRAVLIGRRRGPACHDHGNYIATRESRHIVGNVVVTLADLLRHRRFPDVVNFGAGKMDVAGGCRIASDWLRIGLRTPILPTEMPYGALLPKGLENILVAGKAFSAAHDAIYNLRNQPELENLGGTVGVAAAYAVRDGVSPRMVELTKVQKRLSEIGTLLPEMLTRQIKEEPYDEAALRALVKELDGHHFSVWDDMQMAKEGAPNYRRKIPVVEICTADPALAVPILTEKLAGASGDRKVRLAQALAMFGSKAGAPALIEAIETSILSGAAPPRTSQDNNLKRPPGQRGGLPTPPADLMYSLGMTRDRRALALWDQLADRIKPEPEDFADRMPWPYHYVDSICYGVELLGDPTAIPILEKIHRQPTLRNQSAKKGFQVDFNLEKRALTELILVRALARLGSPEGYENLIEYLDDNRANLAEFAHIALEELTGRDHGKDPQAWRRWLAEAKGSLEPVPLLERVEG